MLQQTSNGVYDTKYEGVLTKLNALYLNNKRWYLDALFFSGVLKEKKLFIYSVSVYLIYTITSRSVPQISFCY
jgi:hypothetical protein